jgi:hypothetical protein
MSVYIRTLIILVIPAEGPVLLPRYWRVRVRGRGRGRVRVRVRVAVHAAEGSVLIPRCCRGELHISGSAVFNRRCSLTGMIDIRHQSTRQ